MTTTELVTKLLAEGGKEFPHQWGASYIVRSVYSDDADARRCLLCEEETFAPSGNGHGECPGLLRAALDHQNERVMLFEHAFEAFANSLNLPHDASRDDIEMAIDRLVKERDLTRQQLAEALDPTVRE